jgi:hypothetical protein
MCEKSVVIRDVGVDESRSSGHTRMVWFNKKNALVIAIIHPSYRTSIHTIYSIPSTDMNTWSAHLTHILFSPSLNSLKTSPATRIASAGNPAILATFKA